MTLARKPGPGLKATGSTWQCDFGTGATQPISGLMLPGPYPIDTSNANLFDTLVFNGTEFVAGLGGRTPFVWTFDPTVDAFFGTPVDSGGSSPTVTTSTDATTGRPFIRIQTADTSNHLVPFFDPINGVTVDLTAGQTAARFTIEAWVRFGGGPTTTAGVAFNFDPNDSAPNFFGVGKSNASLTTWESCVSGTNEGGTVNNQAATDASIDWTRIWVEVELQLAGTPACYYAYTAARGVGSSGFVQKRKTSSVRAAGTAGGIYLGGHAGYIDVASVVVWREERLW